MKLEDRMRLAINCQTSNVILRADVAKLGSPSQVSVVLNRLQKKGLIVRIGKGIYTKASNTPLSVVTAPDSTGMDRLEIPKIGLKKFVINLAKRHKVTYVKTYSDEWAESVTRLAGDEVQTDGIEHLVIALKKAHKVSSVEMVQMLANYLREKERV